MTRIVWPLFCGCLAMACGCARPMAPPPAAPAAPRGATAATTEAQPSENAEASEAVEPASVAAQNSAPEPSEDLPPTEPGGPVELKLDGIQFVVPASWRSVKPQTNIVEAEFELPRVEGDEHDGRLTLMFSGGDPQEVISNRTAEFRHDAEHSPRVTTIRIRDVEATWADLRGEWKGPSFRPIEPRPDYRMLLVIIPCTAHSSFYAKLTGPQRTVAAHELAFRAFIESALVTPPGFE